MVHRKRFSKADSLAFNVGHWHVKGLRGRMRRFYTRLKTCLSSGAGESTVTSPTHHMYWHEIT